MTNHSTLTVLRGMRKLFKAPGNIDREHMASNAKGQAVDPWAKAACKWCVVGSRTAVYGKLPPVHDGDGVLKALEKAAKFRGGMTWAKFVAKVQHARLLSVFDLAIENTRARRKH